MRAHDLISSEVVTKDGEKLGRVFDLEATRTGPVVNEVAGRALELSAVLVGSAAFLHRLGFHRTDMKGPVGLRFLVRRLPGYRVPWSAVEDHGEGTIKLSCSKGELERIDTR
jgi:hypothetical protein